MTKLLILAVIAVCGVIVSCANPGDLPAVTSADADQAMIAMSEVQFYGFAHTGWTDVQEVGDTITATGPSVTLVIVFSPSIALFADPLEPSSSAVITETITNYYDGVTGYTISGTLTCTLNCSYDMFTTFTYSGDLTFSGSGNVRTLIANTTFDWNTLTYTGSVTVNGQTFLY